MTHPNIDEKFLQVLKYHTAGDPMDVVIHEIGKVYWVQGSSLTVSKDDKCIIATGGLVAKQTNHTATPLPHHTYVPIKAYSSATWIKARYIGITSMFTA